MSETRRFLDNLFRVVVVFMILLTILYFVNREGFYAIRDMIAGFVLFLSNNIQLVVLILFVIAIAYILGRRD